jgi:hypothetical protein
LLKAPGATSSGPLKSSYEVGNPNQDFGGFIGKIVPTLGLPASDLIGFVAYTVPTGLAAGVIKPQGLFGIFKDVTIRKGPLDVSIDSLPVISPVQGVYWGGVVNVGIGGAVLATREIAFKADSVFNTGGVTYKEATKQALVQKAKDWGRKLDITTVPDEKIPNVQGTFTLDLSLGFAAPTGAAAAPVRGAAIDASGAPTATPAQIQITKPSFYVGPTFKATF